MNIGIDIDNVISNFDEALLEAFSIHDKELRNNGIIDINATHITIGMFDWTQQEVDNFYKSNVEKIAKNLDVIDGAKEYIDRLKQDGHKIYIITGRDIGEYSDPHTMTKEWLQKFNIYYDELILTKAYKIDKHGKSEKCIENNIDIMIDDSVYICKDSINYGITTLLMDTPYNRQVNDIPRVCSWKEIYDFIKNYKKEKLNVILDTDTYN